jgi:hypothetical protein
MLFQLAPQRLKFGQQRIPDVEIFSQQIGNGLSASMSDVLVKATLAEEFVVLRAIEFSFFAFLASNIAIITDVLLSSLQSKLQSLLLQAQLVKICQHRCLRPLGGLNRLLARRSDLIQSSQVLLQRQFLNLKFRSFSSASLCFVNVRHLFTYFVNSK